MDLLDRLYQRLRESAASVPSSGDGLTLTVADVYQHLVPYRGVRSELGLWELAQYEHALLRLLSGERGYVRLVDPEVRLELQRELAAPNPILGVYRDYPDARLEVLDVAPPPAAAEAPPPSPAVPPAPRPIAERPVAPREPERPAAGPPAPPRPAAAARSCHACRQPLPDHPELRFCPACGADQHQVPCAGCGATLRAEWNFCIRCGRKRDQGTGTAP